MAKKLKPDGILFLVTLVLVGFGVAMVFSSSAIVAKERFGDPNYFSFKQLISATLGLAVMFVVMKIDYHTYRHPVIVFPALAIVVALLVRSEEHTSELQSRREIVCRLLLEK